MEGFRGIGILFIVGAKADSAATLRDSLTVSYKAKQNSYHTIQPS